MSDDVDRWDCDPTQSDIERDIYFEILKKIALNSDYEDVAVDIFDKVAEMNGVEISYDELKKAVEKAHEIECRANRNRFFGSDHLAIRGDITPLGALDSLKEIAEAFAK